MSLPLPGCTNQDCRPCLPPPCPPSPTDPAFGFHAAPIYLLPPFLPSLSVSGCGLRSLPPMTPHPPQPAPTHPSAVTVLPKATRPPWFISVLASPRPRAVVPSLDSPPQLAGSRRASHLSGCFISTPWLASPPPSVLSLTCLCLSGHCPGCLFFQTTPSPYGISYPPEAPLTQQSNHRISTHTCPCHSVPGRSWLHPSIPWPLPTFLNNSLYWGVIYTP